MRKILVVEDIADIREFLRRFLEREGYRVETAEDGIAGLEAIAWFKPELVLLNFIMPRMDGFTMLKTLGQNPPSALPRVVMFTACTRDGIVEQAFSSGALDILFTPFPLGDLAKVIEEVLEPTVDGAQRMIGAKVRHAMDAIKYGGCAGAIAATRRLPLGELSLMQRRDLRGRLLEAVQKDIKERANPKRPVEKWGKFGPGVEPALIATALALAL
jgi:CheY-like chemotaxis protein